MHDSLHILGKSLDDAFSQFCFCKISYVSTLLFGVLCSDVQKFSEVMRFHAELSFERECNDNLAFFTVSLSVGARSTAEVFEIIPGFLAICASFLLDCGADPLSY